MAELTVEQIKRIQARHANCASTDESDEGCDTILALCSMAARTASGVPREPTEEMIAAGRQCGFFESSVRKLWTVMLAAAQEGKPIALTFKEAWAKYEAKGYDYGRDALDNVEFGWQICMEAMNSAPKQDGQVVADAPSGHSAGPASASGKEES
jgi:hypothetical protein